MLHLSPSYTYYLCQDPTDMRKGFDSLSGLVVSQLQLNALGGAVFIFVSRRRNQIKLLLFEGDGFALYHKRLERGTYELPAATGGSPTITSQQLQLILEGISLKSVRHRKRYTHNMEKA